MIPPTEFPVVTSPMARPRRLSKYCSGQSSGPGESVASGQASVVEGGGGRLISLTYCRDEGQGRGEEDATAQPGQQALGEHELPIRR